MTGVKITTLLRSGDVFVPVTEIERYTGDPDHVPGAISLMIDGTELIGIDLWDDVNWLWPFIVQAVDEYRRMGSGKRGFPDQPISFAVESAWEGTALIRVFDGDSIARSAAAPDQELYEEIARAGLSFFDELERLTPGTRFASDERATLLGWRR